MALLQERVDVAGTYRRRWVPCNHEDKVYIKHEHINEKGFYAEVQRLARLNHRTLEWARGVCSVPTPPTDHYALCTRKYELDHPDGLVRRNNYIRWLKTTDGAPYRLVPKNRI